MHLALHSLLFPALAVLGVAVLLLPFVLFQ